MLKIRLQRVGRKHEPVFRVVLTDSRNGPKSGRFREVLGSYDSRRGEQASFKEDRVKHWISQGAQLSATVNNLLVGKGVIKGSKVNVLPRKSPTKKKKAGQEEKPSKEEKSDSDSSNKQEGVTEDQSSDEDKKSENSRENKEEEESSEKPKEENTQEENDSGKTGEETSSGPEIEKSKE